MRKDTHPIVLYRNEHKMRQAELAREIGCHRSTLNLIEDRKRNPSPTLAAKIQAVTGIDARVLLGIEAA